MFFIDGQQDDGTIWVERKMNVKSNAQVQVKISFHFYSHTESFNAIAAVVAYAGIRNPEVEGDFVVLGTANEVAGWKKIYIHNNSRYQFRGTTAGCHRNNGALGNLYDIPHR